MPKNINITDKDLSGLKTKVKVPKEVKPLAQPSIKPPKMEDPKVVKTKEGIKKDTPKTVDIEKGSKKEKKPKKPRKPSKIGIWWKALKKWQRNAIIGILTSLLITGTGAGVYYWVFLTPELPSSILELSTNYTEPEKYEGDFRDALKVVRKYLPSPLEPRTEESPINGLLFTAAEMSNLQNRRPIAVMINNHVKARPQSGLNSADIVYEAVVESGITRYMAIFWSEGVNKVGPIRSARQYHLEWLSPYDALYIHDGCALTEDPRTNACGNIYSYGIIDISTIGAWRANDGIRFAPHDEYNSIIATWDYAEKYGWDNAGDIDPWLFKRDSDVDERGEKTQVSMRFRTDIPNGGLYDAQWTYDLPSNSYLRKIGGQADLDEETGTQVTAKTVIIQEVSVVSAFDDAARVITTTIGQGAATILMDGNIIEGTWKKENRLDRTTFYDDQGKEIVFNRGRIWITPLSKGSGQFDIIEQ